MNIKKRIKKYRKVFLIATVLVLSIIAYLLLKIVLYPTEENIKFKDSLSTTGKISHLIGSKKSLKILTSPENADIFIKEIAQQHSSPIQLNFLENQKLTVEITKSGYFTEIRIVDLPKYTNENVEILVELKKTPTMAYKFNRFIPENIQTIPFPGVQHPFMVYRNKTQRTVEVFDSAQTWGLWPEKLNKVHEINWLEDKLLAVTNGNLEEEKESFIINFKPWNIETEPNLIKIPVHGTLFTRASETQDIAYFGEIDYKNATSKLYTYNPNTKENLKVSDEKFFSPRGLIWLDTDTFITTEINHPSDHHTSNVFLVRKTKNETLEKEKVIELIAPTVEISPNLESLLYQRENKLFLYNIATKKETEIALLPGQTEFKFISDTTVLLASNFSTQRIVLTEIETNSSGTKRYELPLNPNEAKTGRAVLNLSVDNRGYVTVSLSDGTTILYEYNRETIKN